MDSQSFLRIFGRISIIASFLLIILFPWATILKSGISLNSMLSGPSLDHFLGTDNLGRDLLLRLTGAIWNAVIPLWGIVLVGTGIGLGAGVASIAISEAHPKFQVLVHISRILGAIVASIPVGIIAFGWAAYEERAGLIPIAATLLGMFSIRSFLQVHDLFLQSSRLGFWEANRALGGSLFSRLSRYGVISAWKRPIVDSLCFHLRIAVVIEASLSYLGFGIQEPDPSFGNMLASHFDLYLKGHWYTMLLICAALLLCTQVPTALIQLQPKRII